MSTHIALIGRALGADGMILTNYTSEKVQKTIGEVNTRWGGDFFVKMGIDWRDVLKKIDHRNDLLVHLTMYGLRLDQEIVNSIQTSSKTIYVFLGSQKVPAEIYDEADYNIAISNQPQSECGALAIFLDRLFEGKTLYQEFEDAKLRIIPESHGKEVRELE
jgi:tRNA (cytidine56-2'-O)-methyltransferase